MKIAIDGPAGAGKSTVAKKVADQLGYLYVDTGAMYRALTWKALEEQIDLSSEGALRKLLEQLQLELKAEQGGQRVLLNGEDMTGLIRSPEVSQHVAQVASHPEVRKGMVKLQQQLAAQGQVVMDGRDIGTEVLPDADVKIYLTASIAERARRRQAELVAQGHQVSVAEIQAEIAQRDKQDQTRQTAPLKQADDAILVDSTGLTIEQVVQTILNIVQQRQEEGDLR